MVDLSRGNLDKFDRYFKLSEHAWRRTAHNPTSAQNSEPRSDFFERWAKQCTI